MNILHYIGYPLDYAPGGHRDQILNSIKNLESIGVNVDWLHMEKQDLSKQYDLVHLWSYPNETMLNALRTQLNAKILLSTMMPNAGKRNIVNKMILRHGIRLAKRIKHLGIRSIFKNYDNMDAVIVLSPLEKEYFIDVWQIPGEKIFVVPNGIDEIFFNNNSEPIYFDGILQIGAITQIKNSVEVARVAKLAKIKIKFIGDFRLSDKFYKDSFMKEIDNKYVFWNGPVHEKKEIVRHMKGCKGIIQPSIWESFSLVASEALVINQKVMITDAPNLRNIYGDSVSYCCQPTKKKFINQLNEFYNSSNKTSQTFFPLNWLSVAKVIKLVYSQLISENK